MQEGDNCTADDNGYLLSYSVTQYNLKILNIFICTKLDRTSILSNSKLIIFIRKFSLKLTSKKFISISLHAQTTVNFKASTFNMYTFHPATHHVLSISNYWIILLAKTIKNSKYLIVKSIPI